ncbi:uncharacterized protein LOC105790784 [Gossypium raimondii]|nr:uncharacterized protein LOC105790784 [Gossypium raimondii]
MAKGAGEEKKKFSIWDLPNVPMGQLLPHLELQRSRVSCNKDTSIHTESIQYPGAYASMGIDNSSRLDRFSNNFRVEVVRLNEDDMEFDMIGIDAAIANSFRRILIAELPTMVIEKILIANNTSIIQDEVLAHRLGLVPIRVDPRLFDYLSENDQPNEKNTIVFKLHVQCKRGSPRITVKSDALKWLPNGSELVKETRNATSDSSSKPKTYTYFSCSQETIPEFVKNPIIPKYPDIIIAKLGPGQEIELEAHAVKGIRETHAKWSPVATAWYRMLPKVVLLEDIEDDLAEELKSKCPVNVFDIEDLGKARRRRATVARPRACTLCRECIRGDDWEKRVALHRVKDHFIFTIESTGALPPEVLFTEAVKILEDECECVITELS